MGSPFITADTGIGACAGARAGAVAGVTAGPAAGVVDEAGSEINQKKKNFYKSDSSFYVFCSFSFVHQFHLPLFSQGQAGELLVLLVFQTVKLLQVAFQVPCLLEQVLDQTLLKSDTTMKKKTREECIAMHLKHTTLFFAIAQLIQCCYTLSQ